MAYKANYSRFNESVVRYRKDNILNKPFNCKFMIWRREIMFMWNLIIQSNIKGNILL